MHPYIFIYSLPSMSMNSFVRRLSLVASIKTALLMPDWRPDNVTIDQLRASGYKLQVFSAVIIFTKPKPTLPVSHFKQALRLTTCASLWRISESNR